MNISGAYEGMQCGCHRPSDYHKISFNASEHNCGLIGWTKGNRLGVESAQHVAALLENPRPTAQRPASPAGGKRGKKPPVAGVHADVMRHLFKAASNVRFRP